MELIYSLLNDMEPGRLFESLIFLFVLIWRMRPHLKLIEDRMAGIESSLTAMDKSMNKSFQAGEQRFSNLEHRFELMEDRITEVEDLTNSHGGKDKL